MNIIDYTTSGGKNIIMEYIDGLPKKEQSEALRIRHAIQANGVDAFTTLNTRQLKGKLWEIKFSQNRIMYVIADAKNVYFLHACQKQKNKAEKQDLEKAISRAKQVNLKI